MIRATVGSPLATTLFLWTLRLVVVTTQILAVRVLLSALGTTDYAVWSIALSVTGWWIYLDFGLGASVQNRLSEARARNEDTRRILDTTAVLIAGAFVIAIVLSVGAGPLLRSLTLGRLLPGDAGPSAGVITAVLCIVSVTALGGVGFHVLYASHRIYVKPVCAALAAIVSLAAYAVIVDEPSGPGRLGRLLLAATVPSAVVALLAVTHVFAKTPPRWRAFDRGVAKDLLARGSRLFALALVVAAISQLDYVIMSQTVPADGIVEYNLVSRMYSLIAVFYVASLTALRPAWTEALGRRSRADSQRLLKRGLVTAVGLVSVSTLILLGAKDVIAEFLCPGGCAPLSSTLLLSFGVVHVLGAWTNTLAVGLTCMNRLDSLWLPLAIRALVSVVGQYSLALLFGAHGVVAGLGLSFGVTAIMFTREYRRGLESPVAGTARQYGGDHPPTSNQAASLVE